MSSRSNTKGSSPTISGSSNSEEYAEPLNDDKLLLKDIYTFIEDQNASPSPNEIDIPLDSHFGGNLDQMIWKDWKIILPCFQQVGCNRYNNHTIANIHEILNQKIKEKPKQDKQSYQSIQQNMNFMIYYNNYIQQMCPPPNDNFINENKITSDTRTTVMIKNLPSHLKVQDLKDELKKNFDKKYDFIYMPYDGQKKFNLGYAFVNFSSPTVVHEFYRKYNNKRWSQFQSDKVQLKVCTLRYARIQGKRDLITHFPMYY